MNITTENVVELLNTAINEYGHDWVDPNSEYPGGCVYVYEHEGEVRRCIIGQVFHYAGVSDDHLAQFPPGAIGPNLAWDHELGELDEEAAELLANVQSLQDSGHTWDEAVSLALEEA